VTKTPVRVTNGTARWSTLPCKRTVQWCDHNTVRASNAAVSVKNTTSPFSSHTVAKVTAIRWAHAPLNSVGTFPTNRLGTVTARRHSPCQNGWYQTRPLVGHNPPQRGGNIPDQPVGYSLGNCPRPHSGTHNVGTVSALGMATVASLTEGTDRQTHGAKKYRSISSQRASVDSCC
jgi:hypothetical protein